MRGARWEERFLGAVLKVVVMIRQRTIVPKEGSRTGGAEIHCSRNCATGQQVYGRWAGAIAGRPRVSITWVRYHKGSQGRGGITSTSSVALLLLGFVLSQLNLALLLVQ